MIAKPSSEPKEAATGQDASRGLAVRPAMTEDLPILEEIHRQAIERAEWLPNEARHAENFAAAIDGEKVSVCTSKDGALLGFVSIWVADSFIHHLYVRDGARHQGVGTDLLASLRLWLPLPWRLKCVVANTAAIRFYRARGFVVDSVDEHAHPPYALLCLRTSPPHGPERTGQGSAIRSLE
jgi:ribosomal protein S18 acetylase RimI-like enzyme